MLKRIDINADVGEQPEALRDGREEALIECISSANIACGGHAGDQLSMTEVVQLCQKHGVALGAHPSYPDRIGFGRSTMALSKTALEETVSAQISQLQTIVRRLGARLHHVKPHGALYHDATQSAEVASAIAQAVKRVDSTLILVGFAGAPGLDVWRRLGIRVVGEAFADRRYERGGKLRPRSLPDALITDPREAVEQIRGLVREGGIRAIDGSFLRLTAETVCVHSDTAHAVEIAAAIRDFLINEGVSVSAC